MAENTNLRRNIDKISYAAGAVIAALLLALPFLLGGKAGDMRASVQENTDKLRAKIRNAGSTPVRELKFTPEELALLWRTPETGEGPEWMTEIKPAVVRVYSIKPPPKAVHEPGGLVSIELLRDAAKMRPFLRVTGRMSAKNAHVAIENVALEKRTGAGEFQPFPDFSATGDFVVDDFDVVSGQAYAYRFQSHARVTDEVPTPILGADEAIRVSNELATGQPVPHDLAVEVLGFPEAERLTSKPTFRGRIYYWNYSAGNGGKRERVPFSPGWSEGFEFGEVVGGKPRFVVGKVRPEQDVEKHGVTILDRVRNSEETFPLGSKARELASWPAVTYPFEAESLVDAPDAGGIVPTAEPDRTTPPPSKPRVGSDGGTSGGTGEPSGSGRRRGRRGFE